MAVFTRLNKENIINFLKLYSLGELNNFEDIIDGIENTNYKIICNGKPYILTIFEKRVNEEDLPFFMDLKFFLNNNNFLCPQPIKDNNGNVINSINNKKAVIISFIEGQIKTSSGIDECREIGKMLGQLHNITKNFNKKRVNSLGLNEWKKIFNKCNVKKGEKFTEILQNLKEELKYIENNLPNNLPSGVIHADLFKDNIFFIDKKISGVIDFYFSCYDSYLYDISIVINDWCFEKDNNLFNKSFFDEIINNYNAQRKLSDKELDSFNILLRAAAVRILVTRLHDYIFYQDDAIVIRKDPIQYYEILKWHQSNSVFKT
tara:strand:+ start:926 stop:1879 length:954 start_codon:yes stop_codon:yes gene_type:complete